MSDSLDLTCDEQAEKIRQKRGSFKSGLTAEFLVLVGVNLAISAGLLWMGRNINQTWEGRGNLFVGLGLLIACAALVLIKTVYGKRVLMNLEHFQHEAGGRKLTLAWSDVRTFVPSHRRFLRTTIVGDEDRTVVIDSLSFPDYDLIVALVQKARKRKMAEVERSRGRSPGAL